MILTSNPTCAWLARVRRAAVSALAVWGLVHLVIVWTPLPNVMARPLVVAAPLESADALVVLGGGIGNDGSLSDASLRRLVHAVGLYRAGYAPVLILSTANPNRSGLTEARAMSRTARVLGVPEGAIVLEEQSSRTYENALRVAEIAARRGFRKLLVVTTPTHTRRAVLVFRKLGLAVIPAPTDGVEVERRGAAARFALTINSLHEYGGLLYYRLRGWL